MKPIGLISQIAAIALAVAIVTFFVRPTFAEIGQLQDEVQEYSGERERVTETNRILANQVSELESVSVDDRERLATYLPVLLDEVSVLRDIQIIADISGINYSAIQYNGPLVDTSENARLSQLSDQPVGEEFTITVEGTYSRIKDFFSLLEQNEYPLQIYTLEVSSLDGGFLAADVSIVTYIMSPDSATE